VPAPVEVHVVSHTHWDRESYLTREQLRLRLVPLLDRVLDLMDADPRFQAFHLDGQTVLLEDYLEVRPEQAERLRRRIAERRLLVGPWYVLPEPALVGGEPLVRNLAVGHRHAARYGSAMPVGYLPDAAGLPGQLPQILAQFGVASAIVWRGFDGPQAEYWWDAPDGTRALLVHLPPEGYANATRLPVVSQQDLQEMHDRIAALIAREAERSAVGQVLMMAGGDHSEPHPALPDVVAQMADAPGVRARLSTLPAYVEAVRASLKARGAAASLETAAGELRAGEDYALLLPGVLSARMDLKTAHAAAEAALSAWAEPAAALLWLTGRPYPAGLLARAWRSLLQCEARHVLGGTCADAVHADAALRLARVAQTAEGVAERALAGLIEQVEAPPAGAVRLLAVQTAADAFTGVLEAVLELPLESAEDGRRVDPELLDRPMPFVTRAMRVSSVTDDDGRAVPFQVLATDEDLAHLTSRYEPPWPVRVRRIRLALWAADVPGTGYTSFAAALAEAAVDPPPAPPEPVTAGERWMENALLRVEAADDGTLLVRDKRTGLVYRRCGEVEDTGDVGDAFAHEAPAADRRVTGAQARPVAVRLAAAGPLRATLAIEMTLPLPAEAAADRRSRGEEQVGVPVGMRVSLDAGSARVCWETAVDNHARDHRLRVSFPTGTAAVARARADGPFAVVERPARRPPVALARLEAPSPVAPMLSLVDAGEAGGGATVYADGPPEYEALTADGGRLALTLLRCVGVLSRGDLAGRPAGHVAPAIAIPDAQCAGRHSFRYAFEPRGAAPPPSALLRAARAWRHPPRVAAGVGGGRWPGRLPLVTIESDGSRAVLSALKKTDEREGLVLRLFNPDPAPVEVRLRSPLAIARAFLLDLLERTQQELPVHGGLVTVTLPPGRIQTIEVVPDRGAR
jgi:alpha-mannosidase